MLEEPGREQGTSLGSGVPVTPGCPCTGQQERQQELLGDHEHFHSCCCGAGRAVCGCCCAPGVRPQWPAQLSSAVVPFPSLHPAEPCHCRELCQAVAQLQPQPCQGCLSSQGPCWGSHSIPSPFLWLMEQHRAGLGTCEELGQGIERIFLLFLFGYFLIHWEDEARSVFLGTAGRLISDPFLVPACACCVLGQLPA